MCADEVRQGREKRLLQSDCAIIMFICHNIGRERKERRKRKRSQNTVKEVCYKKSAKLTVEKKNLFFLVVFCFFP